MKSLTAVCQTGAQMPAINPNGRAITRHQHPQRENAEMKMYLSKLKDLVPFMPKNRKLSKLEIIQHVIDYICDLQSELETHPEIGNFDAASALNFATSQNISMLDADDDDADADDVDAADDESQDLSANNNEDALSQRLAAEAQQSQYYSQQSQQAQSSSSPAIQQRQPLVDRQAPNTILPVSASASSAAVVAAYTGVQQLQQQQLLHHQQQQQIVLQNSQTTSAEKDSNSRQNSC